MSRAMGVCPAHKVLSMERLTFLIFVFFGGLSYAMILFLIASGLSLIFGSVGVLNLAHGSLYMVGAYLGLTVAAFIGHWWTGLVASGIGVTLIGLAVNRVFLSRLYKQIDDQVVLTLGLVYIFANLSLWIWGAWPKTGTLPPIISGSLKIDPFSITIYRLALIVVGIGIFFGLWWLQDRTRFGAIIRAGMDDKQMVIGLGIDYGLISSAVIGVGVFMSGLGGFLGTPIVSVYPEMGLEITLLAVIVIVVGGVGYVQGTFAGALAIGLIDSFGKALFPDLGMFIIYIAMIVILLVKPSGLLGRAQ
jgi:branched-chain amino acid transport system permease protein